MSEYLSIREVSEQLGFTRQWVHNLYLRGSFPNATKIGGLTLIPPSDVEAYKEAAALVAKKGEVA